MNPHAVALSAASAGPHDWLAQFETHRRGPTANLFYGAVRGGAGTPEAAVATATAPARDKRDSPWANDDQRRHWQQVLDAIQDDPGGALGYAREVLRIESLPPAEREREKERRRLAGGRHVWMAAMVGQPVTDAQLWKLGKLQYAGPRPVDRAEASALIDELQRAQEGDR